MLITMERPQTPVPYHDRIAQAEERLRVVAMRMSQAHELLTSARQRLVLARLALEESPARDAHDVPTDEAAKRI